MKPGVQPRNLAEWLSWQERLHPRDIALGLERVAAVAARLGLTERPPPTLTIGGTNGKGSSAHLAASIYRNAGYRVGLYTSPHLLDYNERIRIDDAVAGDAALCSAFEAIEAARGDIALTYFEFGTLAALWLFREAEVQVQVLEVGLGGRLDAVNLLDADVALVTSIGLDHQDWLGDTRAAIAREKAGIFRRGRAAIVAEPDPPDSLIAAAADCGAHLQLRGRDFDLDAHAGDWTWRGEGVELQALPLPGLSGVAQLNNAAGVLAAVQALKDRCPVPETAIRDALPRLAVPGRCEQRGRFVFDVAHNAEAAQVLAQWLAAHPVAGPTVLLLGMLADKPHAAVLAALRAACDALVLVSTEGPRGLDARVLGQKFPADVTSRCCDNMQTALEQARQLAGSDGRIVITGSFLTVAAAMNELRHG